MSTLNYEPYKDPLTPVKDGFGFMGALGKTEDGSKVQCHICGNLAANLGVHVAKKHGVRAVEYRKTYRLAPTTPLVSPVSQERYVAQYQNLSSAIIVKRLENLKRGREKRTPHTWSKSLEQKNKEGICPDQLIEKIQLLADEFGRTPSLREFIVHYKGLQKVTYDTFGSWSEALKIAELPATRAGRKSYYSKEMLIRLVKQFKKIHGRRPYSSNLGRELPSQWTFEKYFGSFSNALKEVNRKNV